MFRNQYIAQTLDQVYDIEKDAQKLDAGKGDELVYRNLLADQVVLSKDEEKGTGSAGSSDEEGGSEDGASLQGSDDDSEVDQSISRRAGREDESLTTRMRRSSTSRP